MRLIDDESYLEEMLAAIEHGGVTHDGSRHVPRVSHKNTLCIWSPLSDPFPPFASRPSQRARKSGVASKSRGGRGEGGE